MRRYDESVEVREGRLATPAGDDVGPAQFIWRRRLHRVIEVERRWAETADWWSAPEGDDLLAESQVWRVVASSGAAAVPGVYELARCGDASWRLRAVVD